MNAAWVIFWAKIKGQNFAIRTGSDSYRQDTEDEDLLQQNLVLDDDLQSVLAKHDAIASGSPLPNNL
jgi:hypothetical protein